MVGAVDQVHMNVTLGPNWQRNCLGCWWIPWTWLMCSNHVTDVWRIRDTDWRVKLFLLWQNKYSNCQSAYEIPNSLLIKLMNSLHSSFFWTRFTQNGNFYVLIYLQILLSIVDVAISVKVKSLPRSKCVISLHIRDTKGKTCMNYYIYAYGTNRSMPVAHRNYYLRCPE